MKEERNDERREEEEREKQSRRMEGTQRASQVQHNESTEELRRDADVEEGQQQLQGVVGAFRIGDEGGSDVFNSRTFDQSSAEQQAQSVSSRQSTYNIVSAVAVDEDEERKKESRLKQLEEQNQQLSLRLDEEHEQLEDKYHQLDQLRKDGRKRTIILGPCLILFFVLAIVMAVGLSHYITVDNREKGSNESDVVVRGEGSKDNDVPSASYASSSKLEAIKQKSILTCGVFEVDPKDHLGNAGFMADFCRAIAAAIFGQADGHYQFQEMYHGGIDFNQLRDGQVDLLLNGRTITMERQVFEASSGEGFAFTSPFYYDGMHYGGIPEYVKCAENLSLGRDIDTFDDFSCDDLTVCVVRESTHEFTVGQLFPENVTVHKTRGRQESYDSFNQGECNVIALEALPLAEFDIEGPYEIGAYTFSKEPLGIVTTQEDPVWNDFVECVLQGLFVGEARGVGQANAIDIGPTPSTYFGVDHDTMWIDAIDEVGNYAELFNRHLASILTRTQSNTINSGTSGLLYSFPFGDVSETGPGPIVGGTLENVTNRGFLRCGIAVRSIFAYVNTTKSLVEEDEEWYGYDVDFCKAVSAAIFDGDTETIEYYSVDSSSDLFVALANGDIDLISGSTPATLEVDIHEPTTNIGYSLTSPIFYDGLMYGGLKSFVKCAVQGDIQSEECQDLIICVKEGAPHAKQVLERFPENSVMISPERVDSLEDGMTSGVCNTVAGGVADVLVGEKYNKSEYELGSNHSTVDPYALITRQDDVQWSMFCKWIVMVMYYADEQGIDSNTAHEELSLVKLFGRRYDTMFRDAVAAVGSIGDIYERHIGMDVLPRMGTRNNLNRRPYGQQHFPRF